MSTTTNNTSTSRLAKTIVAGMFLFTGMGLAATNAQANWTDCPSPVNSNNLVANDGCVYADTFTQDFLNSDPMTVNIAEGMFGYEDWIYAGRDNVGGSSETGAVDIGFSTNKAAQTGGTWSIDDVWGTYSDIALVFKDGGGTTLVAYALVSGDTSGTYTSPFTDPPFNVNNTKDVSHISAYVRENGGGGGQGGTGGGGGGQDVPEPGILGLMGIGLLGLGASRLRRTRKQTTA